MMMLFKYLHPDRIDVLRNAMICFSQPSRLNDPFECKPHIQAIATQEEIDSSLNEQTSDEKILEKYKEFPREVRRKMSLPEFSRQFRLDLKKYEHIQQNLLAEGTKNLSKNIFPKQIEELGILCLTESCDNLLMWAHYADSHRGFLIEFDADADFFHNQRSGHDEFGYLRQVVYTEKRPSIILSKMDFSVFLTKGLEWQYEREWRMFMPIKQADKIFDNGVSLFSFPKKMIKSIYLGANISDTTTQEILKILKNDVEYSRVICKKAEIDPQNYALNFVDMEF